METLQSTIFIEFDVNTKKITFLRGDGIIDYDSNITNIYVRVKYKNLSGNTVYLTPSELEDYKFSLYTIKPATKNFNEITGEVTDELEENTYGGVVKFEIPRVCTNKLGIVKCEIHINRENKMIASSTFVLDVKQSLVTQFDDALLGDEDLPVLKQLILEIQKSSNIDDNNRSKTTTYSSDKVETIKEDLSSQIKDIENKINKPNDNENNKIIPFNYIDSSGSSSTLFDASNAFNGNLAIHNTLGNGWINKTSNRWIRFTMPIGVVIGDSIAEGHKVTHGRLHLEDGSVNLDKPNEPGQISFHLELLSGIKFINHGIGGQRTDEILNRFNRDVLAKEDVNLTPSKTLEYKPNLIIVSAGVNDILQNKPYENIINNLKSMMEICVENKIYAIFNTIGYFNSITPTVEQIEKIDNVNNWLKLQCDKSKYIKCWDYNKFISSETQGFPNEDLLTDKIHPSKETYRRMSEEIYYTHLSSINFIPKYITISTQVSPNGLFSGLNRPLQIIINYDNSNYSYVYILHNKPIVNIPIPNEVAKPISEIKLTISTGQSPSEVENLTGGSSNFYISEIYGTNVNCDENIIASGIGYLFSNVPDGLSSGRIMISDSEYSKSDNLKLFGVTTGETINNKILIISGTCIMEASESLNENDFVITTTRGKIKKCTDFATENIIARVIRNAGTSNPLEYICEIIR